MLKIMEIAGVEDWAHLKGKSIRIVGDANQITKIGHITKDKWYDIAEVMEEIRSKLKKEATR